MMKKSQSIWTLGMLLFALTGAWAQDTSTPPPSTGDEPQSAAQEPVPAYGQNNAPPAVSENPPLSGLDLPSLQPHAAPLSYLQAGATFSESADSNAGDTLGSRSFASTSRALGSVTMKRLWSNYALALDYVGGIGYYDVPGQGLKLLQQMDLDQKVTWKRGQLSLREGVASLGNSSFGGFWGGSSLGTLGLAPRILNVSLGDVSENLTPKSAITVAGGYSFTHFYGNDLSTGASFIGSSQTSAQVGYNRILTSHTQIALVYGYQGFDFSVLGTAFHSHVIQGMYGHRISGRMDLLVGAGPQITLTDTQSAVCSDPTVPLLLCTVLGDTLGSATIKNTKLGMAAQARLRYQFPRTSLDLTYQRFETSGSGLFAGAQSDIVRLIADRPISRVWSAFGDIGYSRNGRVQPLTEQQVVACTGFQNSPSPKTACPANDATSYTYGFVGGGLHRPFGRNFHVFVSYQFNELAFDRSFCGVGTCNHIGNRSVATFGLDWTPRPIRID
jgi:hypothetical protein